VLSGFLDGDLLQSYLYEIVDEFADMQGGIGELSPVNLDAMLGIIRQKVDAEDYNFVTQSVVLYRWFFQARSSLLSILTQAALLRHGNLTKEVVLYTENYAQDVRGYDSVLSSHRLGRTTSFDDSHLVKCEATSKSLMQRQGMSFADFMNPYIFLSHGDCSHPVGDYEPDGPPWNVPSDFSEWSGRLHYNSDASLDVLVDINETECDASAFWWSGRASSFRNTNDQQLYVNHISGSGLQLKFEWLGTCPTGVQPWVQSTGAAFLANPGCGCRVYAPSAVTWDNEFRLIPAIGKRVYVNRYKDTTAGQLMAQEGSSFDIDSLAVFEKQVHDDGNISLVSSDGKYVTVDDMGLLVAETDIPREAEKFKMTIHKGSEQDSFSLKTASGKYVTVRESDGWLLADSDTDGLSQRFIYYDAQTQVGGSTVHAQACWSEPSVKGSPPGSEIAATSEASVEDCQSRCAALENCIAIVWYQSIGLCSTIKADSQKQGASNLYTMLYNKIDCVPSVPMCRNTCFSAATSYLPSTAATAFTTTTTTTLAPPIPEDCGDLSGTSCPDISGWDATATINMEGVTQVCHPKLTVTGGGTCKDICASAGYVCLRAQDDSGSVCAFNDNHDRQSAAESGCLQKWYNQVCQCGKATDGWTPYS